MTLTPKQARENFFRDGVLILENFFAPDELAAVNTAFDELMKVAPATADAYRPDNWKKFDTNPQQLGPLADKDPAFIALKNHPRFREITAALLGEDFEEEMLLVQVTPRGTGQAWHQDSLPDNPAFFMVNRLIYPRDVDPAAGQVVFVPGSHKAGRIPPGGGQDPLPGEAAASPKAGTIVFLHSHCFHRVTRNETDRPRVSINFRARPHGVPIGQGRVAAFRTGIYDFAKNAEVDPDKK